MTRCITLPNGYVVPLGAYVAAWRRVRAADPAREFTGFDSFDSRRAQPAAEILRLLRAGMHERISGAIPYCKRGTRGATVTARSVRKLDPDWQREARRCAREVNTPRLVVRYVPREFRERLAHRIWEGE